MKTKLTIPSIEEINEGVIKFYSVDETARDIKAGLMETERVLIDEYFQNKGKVLALGCGAGREVFDLIKEGYEVIGVDITPKLIELGREYAKEHKIKVQLFNKDLIDLSFLKDNSFDYVIMFKSVIGHVKNRKDAFREINRVLKPNGILIFSIYYKYRTFGFGMLINSINVLKFIINFFSDKTLEYDSCISDNCYVHFPSVYKTIEEVRSQGLVYINNYPTLDVPHYKYFVFTKSNGGKQK